MSISTITDSDMETCRDGAAVTAESSSSNARATPNKDKVTSRHTSSSADTTAAFRSSFRSAHSSLYYCTMPFANSSFLCMVGASFSGTFILRLLYHCPVSNTNSTFLSKACAPIRGAKTTIPSISKNSLQYVVSYFLTYIIAVC